jgi:hypothetical protein
MRPNPESLADSNVEPDGVSEEAVKLRRLRGGSYERQRSCLAMIMASSGDRSSSVAIVD